MKKILSIILVFILIFIVTGCSNNSSSNVDDNTVEVTSGTSDTIIISDDGSSDKEESGISDSSPSIETEYSDDRVELEEESSPDSVVIIRDPSKSDIIINEQFRGLTAGSWNDNENYDFFIKVLNNNDWYRMKELWGFESFERITVNVTGENGTIRNASIRIYDNNDLIYETLTDSKGVSYIYPNLFSYSRNSKFTIKMNYDQKEIIQKNVLIGDIVSFNLVNNQKRTNNIDIMFTVDTTGSMGDELEYLKNEIAYVSKKIQEDNANNLNIRISTNFYRDLQDEYVFKSFKFEENINKVIDNIERQDANGGGDFPEAVEVALEESIMNHDWNENADAKILFLVLDAPPHNTYENIEKIQRAIRVANEKGIKIIPVASSGIDKETEFLLRFLSVSTNGTYVFLTDDSGVGNSHLEPTIGSYQVELLKDLLVKIVNENIK